MFPGHGGPCRGASPVQRAGHGTRAPRHHRQQITMKLKQESSPAPPSAPLAQKAGRQAGCSACRGSDTICPVGRSIRETVFPRTIPLNALWKTIPFPAGANLLSGSGSANVCFAVPLYRSFVACQPSRCRVHPMPAGALAPSGALSPVSSGRNTEDDVCKWISRSHRLPL